MAADGLSCTVSTDLQTVMLQRILRDFSTSGRPLPAFTTPSPGEHNSSCSSAKGGKHDNYYLSTQLRAVFFAAAMEGGVK